MKVRRTSPQAFHVTFETEEELRREYQTNLTMGGMRLPTSEKIPLFTALSVTLCGPGGREAGIRASVVAPLPDGVALALESPPAKLLETLLESPAAEGDGDVKDPNLWERMRNLPRMEKIMLAAKAERTERTVLLQDNDPQVLYNLLKNPRLTIDEVIRVAKSTFITFQVVELIMKTSQWIANQDVRVALIHNAKTPLPFALRILQTLPESEVRVISRGAATSMALKTAALKRLQSEM